MITRQRLSFSFPDLRYTLFEFNSTKICQHLTNWTRRYKRDKVWSSANSLLKWRFNSRHRRCCLGSPLIPLFINKLLLVVELFHIYFTKWIISYILHISFVELVTAMRIKALLFQRGYVTKVLQFGSILCWSIIRELYIWGRERVRVRDLI